MVRGKRSGDRQQKAKKGRRRDKSRSPSSEGVFKDYQASDLRIPQGWVWKPSSPLEPGLEGDAGVGLREG